MNATAITFPDWTTDIQRYSQKAIFYAPIVWGAFNKTLAPVIISSAKGLASHWFETECLWRERIMGFAGITYNPLTASVSAVITELTSDKAIATYSRIRHITREAATDAFVIGLCGVVAIAEGVEFAHKVYRTAKGLYARVDAFLNPTGPQPVILPTVEMAIALQQEHTDTLEDLQALTAEEEEFERQFMARLERLDADTLATVQDEILQPNGLGEYVPVTGPITNPEPYDIHQDVQERLREIHAVAVDAPAEDLASALHVPGAEGNPKRNISRKKPKSSQGDAEATASAPKRGRIKKK
jgi:hypothetical protein